jgi:hypothetical protein
MPLRDHFHPPISDRTPWDGLHGAWPTIMVIDLNKRLPPRYVASPRIHLGAAFEIDVGTSDSNPPPPSTARAEGSNGGASTAVWAPPEPTLAVATDLPEEDEYEVRVFDTERRELVAAVEIVSPANKDRPDHRRTFVAKCAALLRRGVSVSIVDIVTARRSNLYGDLLELLGQADPTWSPAPPPLYAVACRWREAFESRRQAEPSWRLETWAHVLSVGQPLPTLPLWLAADLAVPLELQATYEETCRILRIP